MLVIYFLAGLLSWPSPQQSGGSAASLPACREFSFEGRVNGGDGFSRRLGASLWLKLLPLKDNGWTIQLSPEGSEDDYGFPLNPPFHSDNSQYLGTGYGDTVEYHLKYEHEVFFAPTAEDHSRGIKIYEQYADWPGSAEPDSAEKFLAILPSLRRALLKLKPLKHLTADDGTTVRWMEFSATVVVPDTFQLAPDLKARPAKCPSGTLN